ncbi:MAG: hypothetical protein JWO70_1570 [Betaproteobacteria bacterium]|nr:hypothetical protein [Betaproteobacteria bacterium]
MGESHQAGRHTSGVIKGFHQVNMNDQYSALIPAAFTTFAHFSKSAR